MSTTPGLKYPYQHVAEFSVATAAKPYIVKGLIALGETSAWIAPPGGMKSALMAELTICIAAAQDWHGMRTIGRYGVVYFALERADLVKRRLMAHAQRLGITNLHSLPITVCASTIDLMDSRSVSDVLATIVSAEKLSGFDTGLIVFDTFAKLVAAGGGDEDKAKDQGKVFANIQRVKDGLAKTSNRAHVALVGHTGKDETRGSRGSNAILGDADIMVTISGDVIRTATVIKANDRAEGPLFSFTSCVHEFGIDEDGDPITVNIVSEETPVIQQAAAKGPNLSKNQKTVFAILHEAGRAGLTVEEWNAAAREAGIGVKRKADLNDIHRALKTKGMVSDYGGRWTVNHEG